ncbi:conserved hypothetical protein [Lebetimonas natsushimae]|uniref:UPF0251 protein LNAT_P1077 n=1 Tax=Lebetimonas natsushimae TaxID=1936991 RepID=A0A292YFF5_9BACT|nr:DUF134 domain-containing protein [Lebetimonas natsushimae]GAX87780.1 conserved hypothetical protein [Lebetimonas natsushimae]
MPKRIRRRIQGRFHHNCFKPCGMPGHKLEHITLTKDEIEAIRLADFKGMYQEDAAKEMEISRPTFSRILNNARKKIATALIEGRAIEIENF